MMKRIIRVILLCIIFGSTSGCWDSAEINEVTVITGIAIDRGETGKYRMSVESLNTGEINPKTRGNSAPTVVFDLEGDSVADLAFKMNAGITRKMLYSHMQTVIIGDKIAREGVLAFFDFLERSREIRSDFNIVIADGVPASDLLKVTFPIQRSPALKIGTQERTLIKEWGETSGTLRDIISDLSSMGSEPVVTLMSIRGNPSSGIKNENMQQVEPGAMVELTGLAIFRDGKYVGKLSVDEGIYLLWAKGKIKRTSIVISCGPEKSFNVRVDRSKTSTKARVENGKPHFDIMVHFEGRIEGTGCDEDLNKAGTYEKFEKLTSEVVEERMEEIIERLQHEYRTDVLGLGEQLERQDYRSFKMMKDQWNEHFSRSDIHITVKTQLRRTGLMKRSFAQDSVME